MRKLLLLPLAIMMAACSSPEIQVMSFNIRLGVANDGENSWPNRCPATIAMLQDQKPDIFGLQEAFDFQIGYINENLPVYDNVGVGRDDGVREGETMAIFWNTESTEPVVNPMPIIFAYICEKIEDSTKALENGMPGVFSSPSISALHLFTFFI